MTKKITVINATAGPQNVLAERKQRVCGYARVSTKSSSQATSYTAQVEYYTAKIGENPLWEFAGVYADWGITGTKTNHRDEFNMMIEDCEDGNIDMILTKSVTRFARNTVECIQVIRRLKEIGGAVYFEKEKINTLTEKGEMLLTVLASVAQGESENISSNVQWAVRKRFQDGRFIVSTLQYGYQKDKNRNFVIVESEAEIVRWIYESYLNGLGTYVIARELNVQEIPTVRGAEEWKDTVILEILKNPVYEGNMIFQKKYTQSQFPFNRKRNHGQKAKYLVEDAHPAIITHEEAEAVRNLIDYRTRSRNVEGTDYNKRYLFSSKIICEECGQKFRRQIVHKDKNYEKVIWTCRRHMENKELCSTKAIREDVVQQAFLRMWNKLYTNRGALLEPLWKELTSLADSRQDSEEMIQLDNEIKNLKEQSRILNQVMRNGYMDSAVFMEKSNQINWKLTECRRKKLFLGRKQKRTKEIVRTEQLIHLLSGSDGLQQKFDEKLFRMTVQNIFISRDHDITFCLNNGLRLTERGGMSDAMSYAHRI